MIRNFDYGLQRSFIIASMVFLKIFLKKFSLTLETYNIEEMKLELSDECLKEIKTLWYV